MQDRNPADDDEDNATLTGAGCFLTFVSAVVIFAVAIPIVRWRDSDTGQALPRIVAMCVPVVIGAIFYGIGSVLLRLVGLRIWSKSESDESRTPEE